MDADHRGTPVMLEVVLDGEVIGRTCACAPRKEARDQGPLGFVFEGGRRLSTHELLRLVVRRAQDGQAIAPLPSAAVGQLQGHLDLVSDTCRLEGWARDKAFPNQPVLLEVLLGEEVLGTVLACRRRRDLEKAGLGDVAFVFEANRPLSADEIETIHLRRINDRAPLCRSDQTRIARDDAGKSKAA
ncbi:MAG TPA: hypothetical protein PLL33_07480 [Paracoccus sp. (in: a-proteobacteria)]|nr:hypothetical protein [Paracoccus sp. (in: a-proteobacteria)]